MYNFEIKTKISCGIGALESLKDITNKKNIYNNRPIYD